jgi:hypothetical protein
LNLFFHPNDTQVFGFPIGRLSAQSETDIFRAESSCKQMQAPLLIVRVPTSNIALVQRLLSDGFLLTETRLCYSGLLKRQYQREQSSLSVRLMQSGEEDFIVSTARDSFSRQKTHYHADPKLDPALCESVYECWAKEAIKSEDPSQKILVAEDLTQDGEKKMGFAIIQLKKKERLFEGLLAGISSGRGASGFYILRALFLHSANLSLEQGIRRGKMWTQLNNPTMRFLCAKLGWILTDSEYTLHKWY